MRVYQRVLLIIVLLLLLASSFIGLIFVVKNCSGRPMELLKKKISKNLTL